MTPPLKMLLIFVDETDTSEELPLYEAIVRRLRQLNVAGATVHIGVMGFGSHMSLHRKGLFGIFDDRPVTISAIDNAEKIRSILPHVRSMVPEGLVVLADVELVA